MDATNKTERENISSLFHTAKRVWLKCGHDQNSEDGSITESDWKEWRDLGDALHAFDKTTIRSPQESELELLERMRNNNKQQQLL